MRPTTKYTECPTCAMIAFHDCQTPQDCAIADVLGQHLIEQHGFSK